MTYVEPPPGWFPFGSHVDGGQVEFSEEVDPESGLPFWERPVLEGDNDGIEYMEIVTGKGESVRRYDPVCTHIRTVPVESDGQVVAYLCTICDAQLPVAGWS